VDGIQLKLPQAVGNGCLASQSAGKALGRSQTLQSSRTLATTRKTVLYLILGSRCVWRDRERRVRKRKMGKRQLNKKRLEERGSAGLGPTSGLWLKSLSEWSPELGRRQLVFSASLASLWQGSGTGYGSALLLEA
jgi:hypothetical protein